MPMLDLHAATQAWRLCPVAGAVPPPCDKLACAVAGTEILLWGGFGPVEAAYREEPEEEEEGHPYLSLGWFGDLYALDTTTLTCRKVHTTGTPPTPRAAHAMCCTGQQMWVFGGRDCAGRQNDLHQLDLGMPQ